MSEQELRDFVSARNLTIYWAGPLEDEDIQIEIYDPGIDQALGLSLIHNQIKQIN